MMQTTQKCLLCSVKLIKYIFSALIVCSNLCVGPLPKIKISFFLLSTFIDKLMFTPKIVTFLPNPVPGDEKISCPSNQIPYPECLYLSISAMLVKVTARNKQLWSDG